MASISIKEIKNKAEDLKEQGEEADRAVQSCQANIASANSRVAAAQRAVSAASRTDDEGRPAGDVRAAMAELRIAEAQLEVSQRELEEAQENVTRVRQEKHSHIVTIDRHNDIAKANMERLRQLQGKAFSENAAPALQGMAERFNEAEDIKEDLLESMGESGHGERASGNMSGASGSPWKGLSFGKLDLDGDLRSVQGGRGEGVSSKSEGVNSGNTTAAPVGGALVNNGTLPNPNSFDNNASSSNNKERVDDENPDLLKDENLIQNSEVGNSSTVSPSYSSNKEYTKLEDLNDELFDYAKDYQLNGGEINESIRKGVISPRTEQFKAIINNHYLKEDTVFYRKASLKDFAGQIDLSGIGEHPDDNALSSLIGKTYQFQGIYSVGTYERVKSGESGNYLFRITASAGTPALDLTGVSYFREAMLDAPCCYIESIERSKYGDPIINVKVCSSKEYHTIVNSLQKAKVEYIPILPCKNSRVEYEIISELSGGDKTAGSCSSLALAYAGNKANYSVLDFRDGESRMFFSRRETIKEVAMLPGVKSWEHRGNNDFEGANHLLNSMLPEKEYYLATGQHASIVRKHNNAFEYLELQNPIAYKNGWQPLNDNVLAWRFKCFPARQKGAASSYLIEVESLSQSHEFQNILGYINTKSENQVKGGNGYVR